MSLPPVAVRTVDYFGLLRMQCQVTVGKPLFQCRFQMLCFLPCSAVADGTIRVAFERDGREYPSHPRVEGIMREQVCQDRAHDSPLRGALSTLLKRPIWHRRSLDRQILQASDVPTVTRVETSPQAGQRRVPFPITETAQCPSRTSTVSRSIPDPKAKPIFFRMPLIWGLTLAKPTKHAK